MKTLLAMLCLGLASLSGGAARAAEIKGSLPRRATASAPFAAQPAKTADPAAGPADDCNLQVDVAAKHEDLEGAASFIVGNGTQANHVTGGEKAYPIKNRQGTGVEFKKWGFIVNILPALDPAERDKVRVQLQVELSGPVKGLELPIDGVSNMIPHIATWQLQSTLTLVRGRKTVVFKAPGRVEITVDKAPAD